MLQAVTRTLHLLTAPLYLDPVDSPFSSAFQCSLFDSSLSPLSLSTYKGSPLLFIHGPPDHPSLAQISHQYPQYVILFTPNLQNSQSTSHRSPLSIPSQNQDSPLSRANLIHLHQRDVTGPETSPLYRFLRQHGPGFDASVGYASPLRDSFGIFVCDRMGRVRAYAKSEEELSQDLMKKIEGEKFQEKEYGWLIHPYN